MVKSGPIIDLPLNNGAAPITEEPTTAEPNAPCGEPGPDPIVALIAERHRVNQELAQIGVEIYNETMERLAALGLRVSISVTYTDGIASHRINIVPIT